jgi:tetratricopeptide (TPR) repeat protein
LRELFGDIDGAIELMQLAYQRTPQTEVEDRAWIATQLGHLEFARGRRDDALKLIQHALEIFPGYHYALSQLAKLRASEKRFAEAVELHRRHVRSAPHPENYYALGVALIKSGRTREGRAVLAEFEVKARAEMKSWDNANRELVMYYVDQAKQPAKALEVAQLEADRRKDVFTLEALAWAQSTAGQQRAARAVIERALAVGIKDADMLYRAGMIAQRQGDRSAALDYFSRSLEANPRSAVAELARRQQTEIATRQERTARIAPSAAREAGK